MYNLCKFAYICYHKGSGLLPIAFNRKDKNTRLSIEIAESQHQQIKALASLRGLSIKDYILEKALPMTTDELDALSQLEKFLAPRIAAAEHGEFSNLTMQEILNKAHSDCLA